MGTNNNIVEFDNSWLIEDHIYTYELYLDSFRKDFWTDLIDAEIVRQVKIFFVL